MDKESIQKELNITQPYKRMAFKTINKQNLKRAGQVGQLIPKRSQMRVAGSGVPQHSGATRAPDDA